MALFNIRVYGLLIDSQKRLLVSDEFIRGSYITKLPGGGLEFGEGTKDCLKREFKEETGMNVTVGEHFYTTDFFMISAFNNVDQIVSIYYFVNVSAPIVLETKTKPFDFTTLQTANPNSCCEVFRWVAWDELNEESLTLPIDKVVVKMLKDKL